MKNPTNLILLMAILVVGCTEPITSPNGEGSAQSIVSEVQPQPARIEATTTVSSQNINEILTVNGADAPKKPSQEIFQPKIKVEKPSESAEIAGNLESQFSNVDVNNVELVTPPQDPRITGMSDHERGRIFEADVRKQLGGVLRKLLKSIILVNWLPRSNEPQVVLNI